MGKFVLYYIIMIKVVWCGFTGYYTLDFVGRFNRRGIFFLCQVVFQLLLLLLKLLSLLLLLLIALASYFAGILMWRPLHGCNMLKWQSTLSGLLHPH